MKSTMDRRKIEAVERDDVSREDSGGRAQASAASSGGVAAPERESGADAGGVEPALPAGTARLRRSADFATQFPLEDGAGGSSRRNILRGLMAVGLLGPSLLTSRETGAQQIVTYDPDWHKALPPGIEQCRDLWIRRLYANCLGKLSVSNSGSQLGGSRTPRQGRVLNASWYVEPAVYFLAERMDASPLSIPPDHIRGVMEKTPQMAFFARGIAQYISFWDVKRRHWGSGPYWLALRMKNPYKVSASFESTEENFVNSIFCCSYPDTQEALAKAGTFLRSNLTQKTEMADEVAEILIRMGVSETPEQSNRYDSPYNRNLCATWSSVWIVNHYDYGITKNESNREKGDMIYGHIETPVKENNGFRFRGPPWYHDFEGNLKV